MLDFIRINITPFEVLAALIEKPLVSLHSDENVEKKIFRDYVYSLFFVCVDRAARFN